MDDGPMTLWGMQEVGGGEGSRPFLPTLFGRGFCWTSSAGDGDDETAEDVWPMMMATI